MLPPVTNPSAAPNRPRQSAMPIAGMIALFSAIVLACVGGLLGFNLSHNYSSAIADARRETYNTARLLEEHTAQILGRVEAMIASAVGDLADPDHVAWTGGEYMERYLGSRLFADGPISSIAVLDPNGMLVGRVGRRGAPIGDLSDRDYFRPHRLGSTNAIYVGPPFLNAFTSREAVPVSRRISGPGSAFLGVVLVTLDPDYFQRFYEGLQIGENGLVALTHLVGTPIVVSPARAAAHFTGPDAMRRLLARLPLVASDIAEIPAVDGTDTQILAVRRVGSLPLAVLAGQSRADVLGEWRAVAWWYVVSFVLVCVAIVGLSVLLIRYVGRIGRAEAALRASEDAARAADQRLRDAVDSLADGFQLWDADDRLVMSNAAILRLDSDKASLLRPGALFADVMRRRVESGLIVDALGREAHYVAERLERRRNPDGQPILQRFSDGRWMELRELRTKEGGIVSIRRDVTAQREREAEIEHQRNLLATTIANIGQAVSVFDRDLRLVVWNDRYFELLRLPRELAQVGRPFADFIRFMAQRGDYGPGDPEAQVAERLALARHHQPQRHSRTNPDGTVLDIQAARTTDGYWVTAYTDVTQIKMREREIEQQHALLEMALASIDQGICIYDGDLRLVAANRRFCEIRGLPPEMAEPGRAIEDSVRMSALRGDYGAGDVETIVADQMSRLRERRRERVSVTLPNGRTVAIQRAPMPNGYLVATYSDLTAERERQAEIDRQRALLELTLASIGQAVAVFDGEQRLVAWNDRYFELLGYPREMAQVGRPFADFTKQSARNGDFGTGDPEQIAAERLETLLADKPLRIVRTRPNGTVLDVSVNILPRGYRVCVYSDITEHKAREREIERQHALLASTLRSVRQGISVFDTDLRLVAWNDRFLELLHFPREFGAAGRPFADFIRHNAERGEYGPGDVEQQVAERVALARNPKPHRFLRTRPDGVVLDVQGEVMPGGYLVTTYGDITEHKAHEAEIERQRAELAEKTSLLEATLSSIDQGICVFDDHDRLVAWNRRFFDLRRYPQEFAQVGRPVDDFIRYSAARGDYGAPDDLPRIERKIDSLRTTGRDRAVLEMPDGTTLDVQRAMMPNGYHVATYADITVQKRFEAEIERQRAELAQKSEYLELTLNHMAQGIAMIAPDRSVVVWNNKIIEMLGMPPALLATHPKLDEILARQRAGGEFNQDPEERQAIERLSHVVDQPFEYLRRRPNGLVIEVSNTPLPGGGAVRTYTDITARKAAEDALRASEERLQHQVEELKDAQARLTRQGGELEATVAKLAAARDAAQAASQAKSDFLTNMSHEIRTPMNGIIGNARLLLESSLSHDQSEWASTIVDCGDALLGLINDILDLSKLEAGRFEL